MPKEGGGKPAGNRRRDGKGNGFGGGAGNGKKGGKPGFRGKPNTFAKTGNAPLPRPNTSPAKAITAPSQLVTKRKQSFKSPRKETPKEKSTNTRETLLQEILALGGEESDLELLEDVLSGSELEDDSAGKKEPKSAKGFKPNVEEGDEKGILAELQSFLSGTLKLDPSKSEVIEIDDAEVEEEEEEEEDEAEDDDDDEEAEGAEVDNGEDYEVGDDEDGDEELDKSAEKYGKEDAGAVRDMVQQMLSGKKVDDKLSSKMLVQPGGAWYTFSLPPVTGNIGGSEEKIIQLYKQAQQLWEADVAKYEKSKTMSAADRDFISTVLKSGTTTDKVSALTLLIQEAPVHSLASLRDQLIHGMARKKARREAILAVDSIKDLFVNNLLPDRKLRYFRDQPLLSPQTKNAHLVLWFFEDSLKKLYFDFIKLLEELSRDPLLHVKNKMLTYISDLLTTKPEQEQNLLALLVNKLGDQDRKLASKASHLLSQLLLKHPAMKLVVVKEVERLLFRPNVQERARYYAITFLNQMILSRRKEDEGVASKLVEIYFAVFDDLVRKNREDVRKPMVEEEGEEGKAEGKGKDKARWRDGKKGKGGKAGAKGKKGGKGGKANGAEQSEDVVKDIDGIDAKMMAALLTGVNRAFPFAKIPDEVFQTHLNTLFTISHIGTFNISIQSLTLIHQVQASTSSLSDRFYRTLYSTLLDSRLYTASKQALYLNLLYRSLKSDTSLKRTKAFIKRIVQTCAQAQVPFVCAGLFLIGEVMKGRPGLFGMCTQAEEEDDEEVFRDVEEEGEEEGKVGAGEGGAGEKKEEKKSEKYDGRKRDPLFANADMSCLWELTKFTTHFHPTVSLYASTLLRGTPITPPPHATNYDPLQNHTLTRFLDRFVFKNPKKVSTPYKGASLMQPRAGQDAKRSEEEGREHLVSGGRKRAVVFEDQEKGRREALDDLPVGGEGWLRRGEGDVPVDEVFFYKYFEGKQKATKPSRKKKGGAGEEEGQEVMDLDDDVDSDQEIGDEEVWEAMRRSSGFPAGGEGEEDEDVDMDMDMMEDDEESDEEVVLGEGGGEEEGSDEGDFEGMEEVFRKMDGFGEGSEDEGDEMAKWAEEEGGEEEEVDGLSGEEGEEEDDDDVPFGLAATGDSDEDEDDESATGAFKTDSLVKGGDEEFAKFFADEEEGDEEPSDEEDDGKDKKVGKKKKAAANRMAQKAKALGYSGSYFEGAGLGGEFASADDFERLLAVEEDEEGVAGSGSGGMLGKGRGGARGPVKKAAGGGGGKRKRGEDQGAGGKKMRRR
ncbi:hypothetical protein HDV00_002350 [Rhizophlyctis rosea]|nr:hypothetical protein HDV00_002350 [Rhizophlyctis rosea]